MARWDETQRLWSSCPAPALTVEHLWGSQLSITDPLSLSDPSPVSKSTLLYPSRLCVWASPCEACSLSSYHPAPDGQIWICRRLICGIWPPARVHHRSVHSRGAVANNYSSRNLTRTNSNPCYWLDSFPRVQDRWCGHILDRADSWLLIMITARLLRHTTGLPTFTGNTSINYNFNYCSFHLSQTFSFV